MKMIPAFARLLLMVCWCCLLNFSVSAQDAAATKDVAIGGTTAAELEGVRRQENLRHAQLKIKDAQASLDSGKHAEAIALFEDAEKLLIKNAQANAAEAEMIRLGKARGYYALGVNAFDNGNYPEAAKWSQNAAILQPDSLEIQTLMDKSGKANDIVEAKKSLEKAAMDKIPKEISNEEFVKKQKMVLELYHSAENYFKSEQFNEAEAAYKEILKIDPYSATAYHRLRETQLAKHNKLDSAIQQTEAESILDVQNGWRLPLRRDQPPVVDPGNAGVAPIGVDDSQNSLKAKLEKIVLPKVELADASIQDVVKYLSEKSREYDTAAGKDGVNITYSPPLPNDKGVTAQPPPNITMSLTKVPLLNVIKQVTQNSGLSYTFENNIVVISAQKISLQRKQYRVDAALFGGAPPADPAAPAPAPAPPGGGFAPTPGGGATPRTDVKDQLRSWGVDFPEGASAHYIDQAGLLVVRNTPEQLDLLEATLLKLDKTAPQVQIEAKFIDVRQSDLQELGFDWAFAPTSQNRFTLESGTGTPLANQPVGGPYRGLANSGTLGIRNSTTISASALDALLAGGNGFLTAAGANTIMTITGVLTNPQVQVMINALSQKGLTNLLSAPRITTTSGKPARIMITREFIYPSSYSDPVVSTSSGGTGGTGVGVIGPSPSAFGNRELGVILAVTPNVSSDKNTIQMVLNPEVIDFEGFIAYTSQASVGGTAVTFTQNQPIFNRRMIETEVTVWDGSTVLLGGLIRDDVVKVNDKIPFLGDIPFFGRLFQSKVDSDIKRNLMIFLTARIVDPSGKPVNAMDEKSFKAPAIP